MKLASALFAAGCCAVSVAALAASGAVVSKSTEIKGKAPADVLAKFGGFCAIKDWHPAVASCEEKDEAGATFRTLTLKDGGKIVEKRTSKSPEGYSYKIVESPLPVKDYMATFSVKEADGGSAVSWTASFQAKGKPESEAKQVIDGIIDAGIKSIAEQAAK